MYYTRPPFSPGKDTDTEDTKNNSLKITLVDQNKISIFLKNLNSKKIILDKLSCSLAYENLIKNKIDISSQNDPIYNMKSIVIFGKGPSVLRCNKEIVDQYDDIAIINYPVINDFFYGLIKDREIKYHFANCGTFDERYNDNINNLLQIQGIYNTNKTNAYI